MTNEIFLYCLALCAVTALAWFYVADQAAGMGGRAGSMGLGVAAFATMWAIMVIAMMFPTVAPTAFSLAGTAEAGAPAAFRRQRRTIIFLLSYLIVWLAFGLAVYAILTGGVRLVTLPVRYDKWLAAIIYAGAGIYQFTPLKRACRERCRSPRCTVVELPGQPSSWNASLAGGLHAIYCIGCCWAFMTVLIAIGLMNPVVMAILTVVIFVERHLRRAGLVSQLAGAVLLAAALLTPFLGWLHPGLPAMTHVPMQM